MWLLSTHNIIAKFRFVDEALDGTENFAHSRGPLNKQVMGPAVVYKEKLVDGQWVPVDME
jgi:hypothetical protein